MKKSILFGILLIGIWNYSHAQGTRTKSPLGTDLTFVGYEVSIPANNNYLSETSWSGIRFDYRRVVRPNITAGFAMSFNNFEQYFEKQTYQREDGTGAITSDMIRTVHTVPFTVSAHYYGNAKAATPYAGIGVGGEYSRERALFNVYEVVDADWGFVVRPEVGFVGKFSSAVGGYVSIAYNYATNRNSAFNIKHLSHFPITVGLVFKTE